MATIVERERVDGTKAYMIQVSVNMVGSKKTIRKSKTVVLPSNLSKRQREKELERISVEYEKEMKSMYGVANYVYGTPDTTFEEFSQKWLERIKRDKSASHYANSKLALKDINSAIGGYKLKDITPSILQYFYDRLDEKKLEIVKVKVKEKRLNELLSKYKVARYKIAKALGVSDVSLKAMLEGKNVRLESAEKVAKNTGKKLDELFDIQIIYQKYAYQTIRKIKVTVQGILTYAKKLRLIEHNFATREYLDYPEQIKNIPEHLSEENSLAFYRFLVECKDIKKRTIALIVLLTGLRRGEICGLELSDIDLNNQTITVRRSRVVVNGFGLIEKEPKNQTSVRTFSIPKILVDCLTEYIVWRENKRNEHGDAWKAGNKL
ncbi:MAG: site-specific integrase, partial [Clostridia bacterium]|nr:site-specific integrase [Clostridia bacterium]